MEIRNRKGDVTDVFIVVILMFFLAVTFIIGIFTNSILSDVIQNTALNQTSVSGQIVRTLDEVNTVGVQRAYTMIFVLMIMFVIGSAFLVRVHPFWMWLYIIMTITTVLVSVFLANTYGLLADNPMLGPIIAEQEQITFFMSHAVTIALITSAISMVIVFSKLFAAPTGGSFGGDF